MLCARLKVIALARPHTGTHARTHACFLFVEGCCTTVASCFTLDRSDTSMGNQSPHAGQ